MNRNRSSFSVAWLGLVLPLALAMPACSEDIEDTEDGAVEDAAVTPEDFDSCIAAVEQTCNVGATDTAEAFDTACFDLTVIPIPLTDGSTYGPMTVEGGPHGGKIDWNQGADTEFVNPVSTLNEGICLPIGVETFNEPDEVNAPLLNTRDIDYALYTIFRPACMREGETYPVITWANGTCGLTHGYAPLLATLASHGFVIIASNSTWTNTSPTNMVQVRTIDYAEALNDDPDSVLYQRLDLDRIGAMGHSQGAAATVSTASDPRVKSLILWNGATSEDKPFLYVSGERDIGNDITPTTMADDTEAASQPGAWVYYNQVLETGGDSTGHLVLMMQPERVTALTVAWWKYMLNDDAEAEAMFVGPDCGFCDSADEFDYGVNSLFE